MPFGLDENQWPLTFRIDGFADTGSRVWRTVSEEIIVRHRFDITDPGLRRVCSSLLGNDQTTFEVVFMRERNVVGQTAGRIFSARLLQSLGDNQLQQLRLCQIALVIARMEERIVNEVMSGSF